MRPRTPLFVLFLLPLTAFAQPRAVDTGIPAGQPVHLVAFGDFGTGQPSQIAVARAIRGRHAVQPFNLGLTLGDNFYECGLRSLTDPRWKTQWEDLYQPLGIKFYPTLGNHDYGRGLACLFKWGDPDVLIAYSDKSDSWKMPSRYYTFTAGAARFIALDTEQWTQPQLDWMKRTLAASAGEPGVSWRIVYGHHPLFSSGTHGRDPKILALRAQILPVLTAGLVDLYIAGHEHDLERLQAAGIDFLIAGGGGADLREFPTRLSESRFRSSIHGFLDLTITPRQLTAQFYDANQMPLDASPLTRLK